MCQILEQAIKSFQGLKDPHSCNSKDLQVYRPIDFLEHVVFSFLERSTNSDWYMEIIRIECIKPRNLELIPFLLDRSKYQMCKVLQVFQGIKL